MASSSWLYSFHVSSYNGSRMTSTLPSAKMGSKYWNRDFQTRSWVVSVLKSGKLSGTVSKSALICCPRGDFSNWSVSSIVLIVNELVTHFYIGNFYFIFTCPWFYGCWNCDVVFLKQILIGIFQSEIFIAQKRIQRMRDDQITRLILLQTYQAQWRLCCLEFFECAAFPFQ